jgi:hypothetical protein
MKGKIGELTSYEVSIYDLANLALKVAKEAYTLAWDIEYGVREINSILGGKGAMEYKEVHYLDNGDIELIDTKDYPHLLTFSMKKGQITHVYLDSIEIEAKYSGTQLIQIGNIKIDISKIFN